MACCALLAGAQSPTTPLPLSSDVRQGVLPNGLTYYILHNEEPKERVNFYIAQKVGSTLENADQLGLAHFLEHMAFNGTKHYPGKDMLNYLQSKGIRFGADINAYTGFDETVYNINNVPSTDKALMDSVLLVLSDWSGSILLEEDEINSERGVIEEEWRSRTGAQYRMFDAVLPKIYSEYQYQQMPIGKMEIVRNFPPKAIRDYYHKWYRPDQQGIVIVGDMDAVEMEKKVKDLFSQIPAQKNPAKREYAPVSDNMEPIFAFFKDKELPYAMATVSFKSEAIPFEMRNTIAGYLQENVIQALVETMINNRLEEYSMKPECKYSYAGVNFGDFWVSKTKAAFDITIIAKDKLIDAYKDALAVVARACKSGFMQSELVRARDAILANYEKAYNEHNNTKSDNLARKLIRTFIDNESYLGAEKEYQMMQQILMMIPVSDLNEFAATILTPDNQVIVASMPDKEGMEIVTADIMTGALNDAINAQYEAYVDEELPASLIENLPAPGKVVSQDATAFGTTTFTLSNGVKVVVKSTDFKADEVKMEAFREGGRTMYNVTDAPEVALMSDAYGVSKFGKYARTTVDKYLAGKKVNVDYNIGNTVTEVSGNSTVKDLKNLFELTYLTFTDIQPDNDAYAAQRDAVISILKNQANNPQFVFANRMSMARACQNPLFCQSVTAETVEKADYAKMLDMMKKSMANAADYTFVFVGNVDADSIKPMLEQYIAVLPSTGKAEKAPVVTPWPQITGQVNDTFDFPMHEPSTQVFQTIDDNNINYSVENEVMVSAIGDILDIIFTDTLREEEGGTYSPQAFSMFNPWNGYWSINYWFQTNSTVQQKLIDRANTEMMNLLNDGAKAESFNKVKEAMIKQYENQIRTNEYWMSNLKNYLRGVDNITNNEAAIKGMTLEGLNKFMKTLYNGKNRLNFVMTGVPEKK